VFECWDFRFIAPSVNNEEEDIIEIVDEDTSNLIFHLNIEEDDYIAKSKTAMHSQTQDLKGDDVD
jgi:hypothetical protein